MIAKLLPRSLSLLAILLSTTAVTNNVNSTPLISKHGITAYTWNSNPTSDKSILTSSSYTFNYGRAVTRSRESQGFYKVHFAGLNCNRGQFTVNAYGGTQYKTCRIGSWNGQQSCDVSVYCFDIKGKPLDSQFNLLFID